MGIFDDIGDFFFGSDDIEPPAQTPEQRELTRLQTEQLRQQTELSNFLVPLLLSEQFNVTIDESGKVVDVQPKDPTELETSTAEIQRLLAQESLKFLRGEGEVPEQVNEDFRKSREVLEESLRKSLGPDFVASTPGQDALEQFEKTRIQTLEGIRFGRLRDVEALGLAREASGREADRATINELFSTLALSGSPLAGLSSAIGQRQFDQNLRLQTDIANKKLGVLGSLFEGVGYGAGHEFGRRFKLPFLSSELDES